MVHHGSTESPQTRPETVYSKTSREVMVNKIVPTTTDVGAEPDCRHHTAPPREPMALGDLRSNV